jgi:hypothetical protein
MEERRAVRVLRRLKAASDEDEPSFSPQLATTKLQGAGRASSRRALAIGKCIDLHFTLSVP